MARHVITIPKGADGPDGGGYDLVWDDEAGTLESDSHDGRQEAGRILGWIAEEGIPLDLSGNGRRLVLNDPLHDPRDFWWLLPYKMRKEPLRSTLPPILRDVEPTPPEASPRPIIIDENGVEREGIPGVDFVW